MTNHLIDLLDLITPFKLRDTTQLRDRDDRRMNIKARVVRPLNVVYNGPILMGQILCTRRINALHFLTSVRVCLTYSGYYTQRGEGGDICAPVTAVVIAAD